MILNNEKRRSHKVLTGNTKNQRNLRIMHSGVVDTTITPTIVLQSYMRDIDCDPTKGREEESTSIHIEKHVDTHDKAC